MLERYGFPYGDRTELWDRIQNLEKISRCLASENNMLHRRVYEVEEELYKRHIRTLQPIMKEAASMIDLEVFTDDLHTVQEQIFRVQIRTPRICFREEEVMNYTEHAIHHCARELAQEFVSYITYKLKDVYHKMRG